MVTAALYDATGTRQGEVELPEAVFGITPNVPVVHEVLTWQLARRRLGTHSTRTRGEVRGGGRKPWRQKGTGRARHGSRRSPLWVGGGITFGPKPRDYASPLPRRVRRLAVRSVLADRAREGRLTVVDALPLAEGRTRELAGFLARLGLAGRKVLLVTERHDPVAVRAAANLPGVTVLTARTLNVHDLVTHPDVVLTREALAAVAALWGGEADGR